MAFIHCPGMQQQITLNLINLLAILVLMCSIFFHCSEMQQQIKLNSDAQPFGKIDSHMQCAANFMPRSQGISHTT